MEARVIVPQGCCAPERSKLYPSSAGQQIFSERSSRNGGRHGGPDETIVFWEERWVLRAKGLGRIILQNRMSQR